MLTSIGSEFHVNTQARNDQMYPAVATFSDGKFVTVWTSSNEANIGEICGQLFDSQGNKLGNEFVLKTNTEAYLIFGGIIPLSDDRFVAIWQLYLQEDNRRDDIFGQQFDISGNPIGAEFMVNTYTLYEQTPTNIKKLKNGNFVVIWVSSNQDTEDSSGVYGQVFDNNCNKIGTELLVNTITEGSQSSPTMTPLNNGNFVVIWKDSHLNVIYSNIDGQLFDETGGKIGETFRVNAAPLWPTQKIYSLIGLSNSNFVGSWGNTTLTFVQVFDQANNKIGDNFSINYLSSSITQEVPVFTSLLNGNFVAVWSQLDEEYDPVQYVRGKIFDAVGNMVGEPFLVDYTPSIGLPSIPGYPNFPPSYTVLALSGGNFLVGWEDKQLQADRPDLYDQVFDNMGNKIDAAFRINTYTPDFQSGLILTTLGNGNILSLWTSDGQENSTNPQSYYTGKGIYGQLYYSPLIANNFNQTRIYTEDTPTTLSPIVISSAVNNTVTASLTLTPAISGSLSIGSVGNTTSSYYIPTGQWQANGPLDEVNALLASTQFVPAVNAHGAAMINANMSDGINSLLGIINMPGIPVTPLIANSPNNLHYIENQILAVDGNLTIIPETDTPMLPNATVDIVSNLVPDQDELNFVDQNNIIGSYDRQTGRLTLTGLSSTENYQTALRNVTYTNLSEKPSTQARTVSFTINDGTIDSPAANRTIEVVSINDAPVVINPLPDETVKPSEKIHFAVPATTFADAENDTLTFKAETAEGETLPSWLNFDAQNQIFSGTAPTNPGKNRFALWAQDSQNTSVKTEFAIDVKANNSGSMFPWWGILLSALGSTAVFGGALGFIYWSHRRKAKQPLTDNEVQLPEIEKSWMERANKGHTVIHNRYALINKISKEEADTVKEQEGLEIIFKEGKAKTKFMLGQGGFGKLRLAYDLQEERYIGVKKIKGEDKIAVSQDEGILQQQLDGQPHIMRLLKSVDTKDSLDQPVLYQFMPLAGFGNGQYLQNCLTIAEPAVKQKILWHVAKSLLLGLQAMHQQKIYHLDLKPANFVLDIRGYVCIIDFGCAMKVDIQEGLPTLNGGRGDMRYYSPERLGNYCYCLNIDHKNLVEQYDAELADAWALGLTLFEIASGYPFDSVKDRSDITTHWNNDYFNKKLAAISELNDPAPDSYWSLIKSLLTVDPNQRLRIKQALELPIWKNGVENSIFTNEECRKVFVELKQLYINQQSVEAAMSSETSPTKNYAPPSQTAYAAKLSNNSVFKPLPGNYGNAKASLSEVTDEKHCYSKIRAAQIPDQQDSSQNQIINAAYSNNRN